jgi:hypothetical protein
MNELEEFESMAAHLAKSATDYFLLLMLKSYGKEADARGLGSVA